MARYLYSELSGLIDANKRRLKDSVSPANTPERSQHWRDMADTHETTIERLVKDFMPSGSGFDSGTKLDLDASHADKLVFTTSYHHMDESGSYDGWTEHTVTVTPSLAHAFNIRISGRNRSDIKDYIHQAFSDALRDDCEFSIWQYTFDCEVKPVWDAAGCRIDAWLAYVATKESRARGVTYQALDTESVVLGTASREFKSMSDAGNAIVKWLKENREQAVAV